jgi:hypothetical protein
VSGPLTVITIIGIDILWPMVLFEISTSLEVKVEDILYQK